MIRFNASDASWDDVRIFLICARSNSFRAAAAEIGTTSSTIVRRMEKFEEALGARLFDRLPSGVQLTAEGQQLSEAARHLEEGAFELQRAIESFEPARKGVVRISVMEGLGVFWVTPRIIEFQRANPGLVIDLQCAEQSADVLRCEADIAVQFTRPTDMDLICVKLGRLHIYPFASRRYLEIFGAPQSPKDIAQHKIVDQIGPQIERDVIAKRLGVASIESMVGFKTNSSVANFYAIEKGAGIGGLPTYAKALGSDVEPVDIGVVNSVDIWMTYHPVAKRTPRIATMIDWVKGCFDPERFPWFRDEFIHPNEFLKMPQSEWVNNISKGTLIGRGT